MEQRTIVMEQRTIVMEKRTIVMEDRTVAMEERRPQESTVTVREDGDDWFILFKSAAEASRKMPTGTRSCHIYRFLESSVVGSISDGSLCSVSASP